MCVIVVCVVYVCGEVYVGGVCDLCMHSLCVCVCSVDVSDVCSVCVM